MSRPQIPYSLKADLNGQLIGWTRVGNLTAVAALLDSPEAADLPKHGPTALHTAISFKRLDVVRYLIAHGFNVNQKGGTTPLHLVAEINSAEMVDILLDAGADATLDDMSEEGSCHSFSKRIEEPHTPFLLAAARGSEMVVQRMIDRLSPDAISSHEWSHAVVEAASNRHPESLAILLHHYPVPGVPQSVLDRALAGAAVDVGFDSAPLVGSHYTEESWRKGVQVFRLLLAHGACPNVQASVPNSLYWVDGIKDLPIILPVIAYSRGLEMVRILVEHNVKLPDPRAEGGMSLFARAVLNGTPDLVRFFFNLEDDEIDLNENVPGTHSSPRGSLLHAAASEGRLEISQFLLDKGADPLTVNHQGWLPIHYACEHGHLEVIELLWPLSSVTSADLVNQLFHLASCWRFYEHNPSYEARSIRLLHFFKEKGADLSSLDTLGKSVLHHRILTRWVEISHLRVLIEAGVQLRPNAQGQTELHLTLERQGSDLAILDFILAQGADNDINTQDNKGRTPLYFYIETHHYNSRSMSPMSIRDDVLDRLINLGADVDIPAASGKTARDLALEKGYSYCFNTERPRV
ncbi:hypothetical protein ASPCADRAFT_135268 [Aspergillus carbonarius ITEM 5010]|uniref:Uncharacterized protein n=1 Tax=Aspergillus carbonarius (strain ITEM 5010) TaxID=602072 RepID=A0A1R3R745_ASPC5|nr:hypothetical protein ASPCADRAFT_135268 [Aspergillus carbonarius ITEM 5010]